MQQFPYQLIRSRRKTLALHVVGDGELQVRAPLRMPLHVIEAFVAEKNAWIKAATARQKRRAEQALTHWHQGAEVPYLGQPLTLVLAANARKTERRGTALVMPAVPLEERRELALQWYKKAARPIFQAAIDIHIPYFLGLGYAAPKLHIKSMKTRWGSLSARGNMSLNVLLMQYPPQCLHSVVVHELCHLVHMNHSQDFYALLSERYPQWREADKRLKGPALSR